jgi:choline dehydrogenase-like flavoprotein
MIFVVGSGPSGVSCARALLGQGADVTLIDAGLLLEPERTTKLGALITTVPEHWTEQNIGFLKEHMPAGTSGIPLKLAYGSDFAFRQLPGATPIFYERAETKPSYARGGLSNVWGAAVLPYRDGDLDEWPIGTEALEPGYRAVLKYMPLAARRDDLEAEFPLFCENHAQMPLSGQATALLSTLEKQKTRLSGKGVLFGASRLAVNTLPNGSRPGCVACGLCMYGCPYQLIYSSNLTIETLMQQPRFRYLSGLIVRKVTETTNGVRITATDQQGQVANLEGNRVFLAAGLLETTSILLRSLEHYDRPIIARDSQYFLLPVFSFKGTPNVASERLHTLAQLFIELFDRSISPYTIHIQTYTYNELFRNVVEKALGPIRYVFPMEAFLGRLLLFQGYLHSTDSPQIAMALRRTENGDALTLVSEGNRQTREKLRKIVNKLYTLTYLTGLLPLSAMLAPGLPGRGFHCGGTFPMRNNPGPGESDVFGRPFGMSRIHAVDSTVFPSVPATTITFTVMANAYRIGSLLPQYA